MRFNQKMDGSDPPCELSLFSFIPNLSFSVTPYFSPMLLILQFLSCPLTIYFIFYNLPRLHLYWKINGT